MPGQTNVSTATTNATTAISSTQTAKQKDAVSSPIVTLKRKPAAATSVDQQPYGKVYGNVINEASHSGRQPDVAETANNATADATLEEDVKDTVESLVSIVSNKSPHPSSVVRITDDRKVPDDVLRLINGKSPDEVVNIINGQLAELKAIETLRDVEEECLDELTNEIIAKITKDSTV